MDLSAFYSEELNILTKLIGQNLEHSYMLNKIIWLDTNKTDSGTQHTLQNKHLSWK